MFSAILLLFIWTGQARASGFEESELRKYVENLRKAEKSSRHGEADKEQTGIARVITLLDEDEPDLKALETEIASISTAVKPGARHYLLSRYAMAVAFQKTGQFEKAADLAISVLEDRISKDWQYAFYEIYFYAAWELDRFEQIAEHFPRFSKIFGVARKNEKIAVIAYQSFVKTGEDRKGIEILEELVRNYPATEHSRYAFNRLVERTCEKSRQKRYVFSQRILVQLSRNNDLGNGVREFVLSMLDQPMEMDDGSVRRLWDNEKTEFLFKTRMYDEALALLREQYESKRHNESDPDLPDLMYNLARTLMRQQDYRRSAQFASKFLSIWTSHPVRNNMKEVLADSLRYLNVSTAASTLYKELSESSTSDHFRWQTFWSLYMGRQYDEALAVLQRPETRISGSRIGEDGVLYWEGTLLSRLGRKKEANEKYAQLMNRHPHSFYASYIQLSRETKSDVASVEEKTGAKSSDGVLLASFNQQTGKDGAEKLGPNRLSEVITFAESLSNRGREDLARLFLSEVDAGKVADWPTYKGLADISFKLGIFKPTHAIRYKKFSPLSEIPDDWLGYHSHIRNNPNHWRVYFPYAYGDVVGSVAETFNRSRFLILSIMRAESFYNQEARSPVGAIGLMQMMPYTAIKIANLVRDFDFKISDLTKPEYSIGYGGYYIDKLQRYYQENPILAVAAYNAGPKAVNQWIESCKQCTMDEFVESIPYRETRNYVKKVISYFFSYFRVYNAGTPNFQNLNLPEYFPETEEIF
jgi:tetratricopeptide (TPR) repeat protein